MAENTETLTGLFWKYRAAWQASQQVPGDATLLAAMHAAADVFATSAYPVMHQMGKTIMKGQATGRDIAHPEELASVVFSKRFLVHPMFPKFECDTTAPSQSQTDIEAYLYRVLENEYLDDWRRLHGRSKAKSAQPSDPDGADAESSTAEKGKDDHIPRIYVNIDDPVVTNEVGGIGSDRRTQSGYYALQQTRHYLEIYLRQMPGSIVKVLVKATDPTRGLKSVTLTQGHAVMLRLWMAGDGMQGWREMAQELGRPEGTVKRWFSEVTKHFKTDTSSDAVALRSLYAVKDSAIPAFDEEQEDAITCDNAILANVA